MRRAAQPRGARRADRVLRWADRVPRGDRGHLAAQHCADVHGAPDSGGDAVRHLRAPQEGRRGAAPDLHRPDRGGRRVRAAGLRRLPARPKVPGDRGDLGERLGAVYPVFGFPARAAPDHLHHQRRGEPELPAPEDHQEPGALPQRRRRDQAAVAGHPRHRRQTRPSSREGEGPAAHPAHRPGSARRRRHRAGLESRPRRAGFGLPRPARRLPHLTPFLRHGHPFPPRRRSPRGAPAAQRGRTTWTPTSGGRRSTAEEISTADRFTYTDILTSSCSGADAVLATSLNELGVTTAVPLAADEPEARQLLERRPPTVSRYLDLEKAVSSAVRARLFVGAACTDWQLDPRRYDAMIVSSELVANAVLHARTECRLTVQLDARGLTIAVHDHRRGWIKRRPSIDPTNLGGLGLFVVDRLSRSWGTTPTADGKKVWPLLPMPAPPTERRNE